MEVMSLVPPFFFLKPDPGPPILPLAGSPPPMTRTPLLGRFKVDRTQIVGSP